jgi:nucleoside-diphosphate-sugar epimerase
MTLTQTIAVTGATGFIGRTICRQLLDAGFRVRALTRSKSRSPGKSGLPQSGNLVEVSGSLENTKSLKLLVQDTAAVVHCAGAVRGATQQDFDRVNVDGVRNLLNVLEGLAEPPRLLTLSSLAAREPGLSYYAASKYQGEQVLINEASKVSWMALRPPAVYGPGDRELLPLFRAMGRGIAPVPGSPEARFSMVFVEDLAGAVIAWLRCQRFTSGVYSIDDGRAGGYDWPEVAQTVARLCSRKVRLLRVPEWLLDIPARVNRQAGRVLGYAPMLTPEKLRELRHPDWVCDSIGLTEQTGWQPAVQLEEGLRLTPGWCGFRSGL